MTIRNRLTMLFTGAVAASILVFSILIYLLSERYRQIEFDGRLREKAIATAEFVSQMDELKPNIIQKITKQNSDFLTAESELVYDEDDPNHTIIYTSGKMDVPNIDQYFFGIKEKKQRHVKLDDNTEMLGVLYTQQGRNLVSVAKAFDQYGLSKQRALRRNLAIALLASVLLVLLMGWYYSQKALQPINNVIQQVENLGFDNLDRRVVAGQANDEIWQLANTFNGMLARLKSAFEAQKSFVSNASHELRTPLTAMNGQIEVALLKNRSIEEYQKLLHSLKEDIAEMTDLSNSLLDLASVESGVAKLNFETIRLDDVVWQAQAEVLQKRPQAKIHVAFGNVPTDEEDFLVAANEQLLKTALINLIENACKFSNDQTAVVTMTFETKERKISVKNFGNPIAPTDLEYLFVPFFRSENTKKIKGHGIGLPLTKKIVELHHGQLQVMSSISTGTEFIVKFTS
jgi:signal transduction histidine kinase